MSRLQDIARKIVADGRGILAADESTGTIAKRFATVGVASTEETRRAWRATLCTSPCIEDYVGGVILFDETARQTISDGTPFPEFLRDRGIVPGIKVDKGTTPMALHGSEVITEGLDGLRDRLAEYSTMGLQFAKWRAVLKIGDGIPSDSCTVSACAALAQYAALCQEQGLVSIIEPEVLMDGSHSIERCGEITRFTLDFLFAALRAFDIELDGILLKPNMVLPGSTSGHAATPEEVAEATLNCLYDVVPASVPGIVFLSGGLSELDATANLNSMNLARQHPWALSFSYGRALQSSALEAWGGEDENVGRAQAVFCHRAKMNSLAARGRWSSTLEKELSTAVAVQ